MGFAEQDESHRNQNAAETGDPPPHGSIGSMKSLVRKRRGSLPPRNE
jgi:hypothetical protein